MCLFVPKLLRNDEPQRAEIFRDDSPWYGEGFRLKNIQIPRTVSWKIACILASSVQFYSLQCESLAYLEGW